MYFELNLNIKKLLFSCICLFSAYVLSAQTLKVPKDVQYEVGEDYAIFEEDVLKVCDWMIHGKVTVEFKIQWKEAADFLMKWIEGSPTVYIPIQEEFASYISKEPALLMVFMAGWTKYSLENKIIHDNVNGNMAGINAVIQFYETNQKQLGKIDEVEKLIKMKNKNTLLAYIKKHAIPDKQP